MYRTVRPCTYICTVRPDINIFQHFLVNEHLSSQYEVLCREIAPQKGFGVLRTVDYTSHSAWASRHLPHRTFPLSSFQARSFFPQPPLLSPVPVSYPLVPLHSHAVTVTVTLSVYPPHSPFHSHQSRFSSSTLSVPARCARFLNCFGLRRASSTSRCSFAVFSAVWQPMAPEHLHSISHS